MSDNILAGRLKKLRENSGFMQKYVADKIGVRSNTLSGYENGTRTPDPQAIRTLAEIYNVTTDYLLGQSDIPRPLDKVIVNGKEIELSIEELQLFEELKKHPIMFHDLASDPEKKVKELIRLYKAQKFLENKDEDLGDGFGELED